MDNNTMECPNYQEPTGQCACMRNKYIRCGEPVGNITFTVCDDCWEEEHFAPCLPLGQKKEELVNVQALISPGHWPD